MKSELQQTVWTWRRRGVFAAALLLTTWPASDVDGQAIRDAALLKKYGVEANAESIGALLASLQPGGKTTRQVELLLQRLGHDRFAEREAAMAELLRMSTVPLELVNQAAKGDDPEIRWRAEIVSKQAGKQSKQLLRAALHLIQQHQLQGLAKQVLGILPQCQDASLRRTAQQALIMTAMEGDEDRLRAALSHPDIPTRITSMRALVRLAGAEATAAIHPLLRDASEEIRLATALALANLGDREAMVTLATLLDSPKLEVRVRGVQALRSLTGNRFQFVAYEGRGKTCGCRGAVARLGARRRSKRGARFPALPGRGQAGADLGLLLQHQSRRRV